MFEEVLLSSIKSVIGDKYIGDDCAYINDTGLVVSQDNLIEDVHFSLKYMSFYQLGYKSAMVNISDIAASGCVGDKIYMTVGLSLPKNISDNFIKEFYTGLRTACDKFGVKIIGGDLTGADKIMVSITVFGINKNGRISSRKNAKTGYVIVTDGFHGSSAAGLKILKNNMDLKNPDYQKYILAHLSPEAQINFGKFISLNVREDYAMMDSSDGLADALYKIAVASNKSVVLDFSKVSYEKDLENLFPNEYKDMVLYGGEDYCLIAAVPEEFAIRNGLNIIGKVIEKEKDFHLKIINCEKNDVCVNNLDKCFNHFK